MNCETPSNEKFIINKNWWGNNSYDMTEEIKRLNIKRKNNWIIGKGVRYQPLNYKYIQENKTNS